MLLGLEQNINYSSYLMDIKYEFRRLSKSLATR